MEDACLARRGCRIAMVQRHDLLLRCIEHHQAFSAAAEGFGTQQNRRRSGGAEGSYAGHILDLGPRLAASVTGYLRQRLRAVRSRGVASRRQHLLMRVWARVKTFMRQNMYGSIGGDRG